MDREKRNSKSSSHLPAKIAEVRFEPQRNEQIKTEINRLSKRLITVQSIRHLPGIYRERPGMSGTDSGFYRSFHDPAIKPEVFSRTMQTSRSQKDPPPNSTDEFLKTNPEASKFFKPEPAGSSSSIAKTSSFFYQKTMLQTDMSYKRLSILSNPPPLPGFHHYNGSKINSFAPLKSKTKLMKNFMAPPSKLRNEIAMRSFQSKTFEIEPLLREPFFKKVPNRLDINHENAWRLDVDRPDTFLGKKKLRLLDFSLSNFNPAKDTIAIAMAPKRFSFAACPKAPRHNVNLDAEYIFMIQQKLKLEASFKFLYKPDGGFIENCRCTDIPCLCPPLVDKIVIVSEVRNQNLKKDQTALSPLLWSQVEEIWNILEEKYSRKALPCKITRIKSSDSDDFKAPSFLEISLFNKEESKARDSIDEEMNSQNQILTKNNSSLKTRLIMKSKARMAANINRKIYAVSSDLSEEEDNDEGNLGSSFHPKKLRNIISKFHESIYLNSGQLARLYKELTSKGRPKDAVRLLRITFEKEKSIVKNSGLSELRTNYLVSHLAEQKFYLQSTIDTTLLLYSEVLELTEERLRSKVTEIEAQRSDLGISSDRDHPPKKLVEFFEGHVKQKLAFSIASEKKKILGSSSAVKRNIT